MADPHAVLGVSPGASKAEIKAAFRKKAMAHHPDMHTTASEHVRAANDAAFKQLNQAYQALMEGGYQRRGSAAGRAYGRGAYGAYTGSYGSYNQGSSSYQGAGASGNPFESSFRPGTGSAYWDFRAALGSFAGLGRAEAAATAALGLLLASTALLAEPLAGSLWESHNQGKLFSGIEAEAARRKQVAAAADAAAAAAARRAAAAAQQQRAAMAQQLPVAAQQLQQAAGGGGIEAAAQQARAAVQPDMAAAPAPAAEAAAGGAAGAAAAATPLPQAAALAAASNPPSA